MADMLLVGTAPTSEDGKEFFLYSTDWWYDIFKVFIFLLSDIYPLDEYFTRDLLLAPPTPTMDGEESLKFSKLVDKIVQDGSARMCLGMIYNVDPIFSDYFDEDEEIKNLQINEQINERIEQIETFSKFLKDCGGCAAKWYIPE